MTDGSAAWFPSAQADPVTEGGETFVRLQRKWGRYLAARDWVTAYRAVSFSFPPPDARISNFAAEDGSLEFTRLANGNLSAHVEYVHSFDKAIVAGDYLVALDPYRKTFRGIGITPGVSSSKTISGSFEPGSRCLDWIEYGQGVGSAADSMIIKTWAFVAPG